MPQSLASEVLARAVEGERALKDALHSLVVVDKEIAAKWLADASGYTESAAYKAMDREAHNALPFRTLDAAALGSRTIAGAILRILSERWAGRQDTKPATSLPETLHELAEAGVAQAHSQAEAYAVLADGEVNAEELAGLERLWAREDAEREQGRDAIRSMCRERVFGLRSFGSQA